MYCFLIIYYNLIYKSSLPPRPFPCQLFSQLACTKSNILSLNINNKLSHRCEWKFLTQQANLLCAALCIHTYVYIACNKSVHRWVLHCDLFTTGILARCVGALHMYIKDYYYCIRKELSSWPRLICIFIFRPAVSCHTCCLSSSF